MRAGKDRAQKKTEHEHNRISRCRHARNCSNLKNSDCTRSCLLRSCLFVAIVIDQSETLAEQTRQADCQKLPFITANHSSLDKAISLSALALASLSVSSLPSPQLAMSLEASLRLNGSNFLPEEEHLFYTFDSERKTTAKVFLPSAVI